MSTVFSLGSLGSLPLRRDVPLNGLDGRRAMVHVLWSEHLTLIELADGSVLNGEDVEHIGTCLPLGYEHTHPQYRYVSTP